MRFSLGCLSEPFAFSNCTREDSLLNRIGKHIQLAQEAVEDGRHEITADRWPQPGSVRGDLACWLVRDCQKCRQMLIIGASISSDHVNETAESSRSRDRLVIDPLRNRCARHAKSRRPL